MDDETYTADPHVIVVGGGYAGMHAARAAKERGARVTLVDRDGRHDFVTRLASVAGGTAPVRDASVRSNEFVDVVERATVTGVSDGAVQLSDGRELGADAVVLTTGARVSTPPIEGLEHAHGLRTAEDAKLLRGLISSSESLVIIGGGATGVQLAGAAAIAHRGLRIHLLESRDRLLAELPAELGSGANRILRDRGVHVELGNEVERVTTDGVETSSGPIEGLVVWAGGFSADAASLGVPCSDTGRVLVDGSLRVEGMEHTFAAGDIAAHVDAKGEALPMSAQVAVRAGTAAGANAARVAQGREPRPGDSVADRVGHGPRWSPRRGPGWPVLAERSSARPDRTGHTRPGGPEEPGRDRRRGRTALRPRIGTQPVLAARPIQLDRSGCRASQDEGNQRGDGLGHEAS